MNSTFKTPIIYLCFNRPDLSEKTLSRIAEMNPEVVLVVSDGPREQVKADFSKVDEVRSLVEKKLSKDQLIKKYSEKNLGCRRNVSSGLTWAFEVVDRAIIIEDDCLPDLSFFRYCQELLDKYADDESVAQISGSNLLDHDPNLFSPKSEDYFFSRFPFIWGWATWARSWKNYDVSMCSWKALSAWEKSLWGPVWKANFDSVATGKLDTWDFQWVYAVLSRKMKNVMPSRNLVTNLGFRSDATHTVQDAFNMSEKPLCSMPFPMKSPLRPQFYDAFDKAICRHVYGPNTFEPLSSPYFFAIKSFLKQALPFSR